jgi:acyl-CoA dehydrogenase
MTADAELISVIDAALSKAKATHCEWDTADELGWTRVGIAESAGGYGGDISDALAIMEGAGRHAVDIPLLESLLANTILGWAGLLRDDDRPACVLFGDQRIHAVESLAADGCIRLTGHLANVWVPPGAARCVLVGALEKPNNIYVVDDESAIQLLQRAATAPGHCCNLHIDWHADKSNTAVLIRGAQAVTAHWALFRAAWVLGTIDRVIEMTIEHVQVRKQFGRSLSSFQAVQHHLARMACERNLLRASVALAATRNTAIEACYAARLTAANASDVVSKSAHQLFGAIGITHEHPLHIYTTSLRRLRDDLHTHRWWLEALGARLSDLDEEGIWTVITTGGNA